MNNFILKKKKKNFKAYLFVYIIKKKKIKQ